MHGGELKKYVEVENSILWTPMTEAGDHVTHCLRSLFKGGGSREPKSSSLTGTA